MTSLIIDSMGNKYWLNSKGKRHKEGGPAWESVNGCKAWYKNGQLHREDGPAVTWSNGDKRWYLNGRIIK